MISRYRRRSHGNGLLGEAMEEQGRHPAQHLDYYLHEFNLNRRRSKADGMTRSRVRRQLCAIAGYSHPTDLAVGIAPPSLARARVRAANMSNAANLMRLV
jgi:hypothetical protein